MTQLQVSVSVAGENKHTVDVSMLRREDSTDDEVKFIRAVEEVVKATLLTAIQNSGAEITRHIEIDENGEHNDMLNAKQQSM